MSVFAQVDGGRDMAMTPIDALGRCCPEAAVFSGL